MGKIMNKSVLLLTVAASMAGFFSCAAQSVLIGQDNFDGTATYLTRGSSLTNNSSTVTWEVVNRSNVQSAQMLDTSKYLANGSAGDGTDTLGFLKSTKTDSFFGLYRGGLTAARTLTYTFNIAGYTNLNLAMDWAATGDIPDPLITMDYSIDGAAAKTNFVIGVQANANWVQTMEDGRSVTNARAGKVTVNGVAGTSLSDVFQTYTPTITGTGSVLTVTLKMATSSTLCAFGMDNLKLSGTAIIPPKQLLGLYIVGAIGQGAVSSR
jgi:hypothetical protein